MSSNLPASPTPLDVLREVNVLCDRFEQALRRGEKVQIDDFLPAAGPAREAALVELVRVEIELRRRAGETVTMEEYIARYPRLHQARTLLDPPPIPPPPTPSVLPSVPGYEIRAKLGEGGMGVVYSAWQVSLKRVVALKMMLAGPFADQEELARFRTEAEAVASLQHPHIVQIHEIGEAEGRPYIALEFCPSGSLADKLRGTVLPAGEAAAVVETLARTMHAVHERKIVHRDLKPANVLLTEDGTPKVTDFGLAKKLDEPGKTETGTVMGSAPYMAPEQASGEGKEIGPATDVYALGAILYECLTGRPPFKAATTLDTLMQVREDEPVPPRRLQSKTPRDLETVCLKCLQKDGTRRYSSAAALAEDLRRFRAGEPIVARPMGPLGRAAKWARRRPAVAVFLALFVVSLIAGASVSTGLAIVAHDRADQADRERDRANNDFHLALTATRQMLTVERDQLKNAPQMELGRRDLLENAVQSYTELVKEEPDDPQLRFEIGQAWNAVGDIYRLLGERDKAADAHRRAVEVLDKLRREHPEEPKNREELAAAYQNLALAQQTANPKAAEENYNQALDLLTALVKEHGDRAEYRRYLGHTRGNLAALYQTAQDWDKAIGLTEQTAKDLETAAVQENDPSRKRQDQYELAKALDNLGMLYAQTIIDPGEPAAKAEGAMNRAMTIREDLVRIDGGDAAYQQDLAISRQNMAVLYLNFRPAPADLAKAEEWLEGAVDINIGLASNFRRFPEHRLALVRNCLNLAALHDKQNHPDRAAYYYGRAVDNADQLARDFPRDPECREQLLGAIGAMITWAQTRHRNPQTPETTVDLQAILLYWAGRAVFLPEPEQSMLSGKLGELNKQLVPLLKLGDGP